MWRLSATLTDCPGLVAELTNLLELDDIDIIRTRSTVLDRIRFMVDMHLDCNKYNQSRYDLTSVDRQSNPMLGLEELHARICASLIRNVDLPLPLFPKISLSRNHVLSSAGANSYMQTIMPVRRGRLDVKGLNLLRAVPAADTSPDSYYMVADQDHLVLRLFRICDSAGVIHARFEFKNEAGALRKISKRLSDRGFTVLQAYARPVGDYRRCRADVAIAPVATTEPAPTPESCCARIEGVARDLTGPIECRVEFPRPRARTSAEEVCK